MISIKKVSKSYKDGIPPALDNISLEINRGETLVLLGSSGCGKTTLLKTINRLVTPSSGSITFKEKNINKYNIQALRRDIGYVFQGVGLFPHMSVSRNLSIVLEVLGEEKKTCQKRARELLELVQMDPQAFENRHPNELSGGQKQRIGVARALAANPDVLLMDEPFGALDAITRDALQKETIHLKNTLQKTIVFVTHDIFEAFRLADTIAVMNQGRIEQIGTKQALIRYPATEFVKNLIATPIKQLETL